MRSSMRLASLSQMESQITFLLQDNSNFKPKYVKKDQPFVLILSSTEPFSMSSEQCKHMITFLQAQMVQYYYNFFSHKTFSILDLNSWIIDYEETSHICYYLSLFTSYTNLYNKFITLPNNLKIHVPAIGNVDLSPSLKLTNVLFILEFNIQDTQPSKVIGKGRLQHGLNLYTILCTNNSSHKTYNSIQFHNDKS
ncbi:hypothetical protein CR513_36292, partial [Mucuna pruriens]